MKQRILFVCLGNICRSPAAEAVMNARIAARGLGDEIETDSAGTYGGHSGDRADPRMRAAASRRGYTLTHRARRITEEDFERSFAAFQDYDSNNSLDAVESGLCEDIVEILVEDIFNATVANW